MPSFTAKVRNGIYRCLSVFRTEQAGGHTFSVAGEKEVDAAEEWLDNIPRGTVLVPLSRADIHVLLDAAKMSRETWDWDADSRATYRSKIRSIERASGRLLAALRSGEKQQGS